MTDRTYWAIALDRNGRTIGEAGPFISREAALKEIRFTHPTARSYSVGYGATAPMFDIRNERNVK